MGLTTSPIGSTWAIIAWSPPTDSGGTGVISIYEVTAVPHPFYGSELGTEGDRLALANSSCVEFDCETVHKEVPNTQTTANLTNLVPGVQYVLTVIVFSILQSKQSQQVNFTTQAHGMRYYNFSKWQAPMQKDIEFALPEHSW